MPRAERVLDGFPAYARAGEPGKLLGDVVGALAAPIEEADTHLFRIQRAHRLLVADDPADVVRLAAALNLTAFHFEDLLGDGTIGHEDRLDRMRDRVRRIARLHLRGLGTPSAVLEAAAIFLDARIVPDRPGNPAVRHLDPDGFIHRVTVELGRGDDLPHAQIHLYENPVRRRKVDPAPRWPLDDWDIDNANLGSAPLVLAVQGVADRTVRPSVFSPDTAEGLVFDGIVPDGSTLLVDVSGGALLDGRPVDDWLIHFRGGVFDYAELGAADAVLEDGPASSAPFGGDVAALTSRPFRRRHAVPEAPVGRSAWTFAVAEGLYDGARLDFAVYATEHLPIGVLDGDVGLDECVYDFPPSGVVGMAWNERVPCAFKLVLPPARLLEPRQGGPDVDFVGRVSGVLPRFKPAGIRAYVDTSHDAWVLGESVIRETAATEGEGVDWNATRARGPLGEGFVPLDTPV